MVSLWKTRSFFSKGRLAATNPHQSQIAGAKGRPPKNACADVI
jgi:hypothetical protein